MKNVAYLSMIVLAAAITSAIPVGVGAIITDVDEADDVCAPADDPCVIDQPIEIVNFANLDFGTRAVEVRDGGRIDIGAERASISCGNFTATIGGAKLIGGGEKLFPGFPDRYLGELLITARSRCSADPAVLCAPRRPCNAGDCAQRCSADFTRSCRLDGDCDLGTCLPDSTCSSFASRSCASNTDCQLGTCSALRCSGDPDRSCEIDVDCEFGPCLGGAGNVDIDATVNLGATSPGDLDIQAAGEVVVRGPVRGSAGHRDEDAAVVEIESATGSIHLMSPVRLRGGTHGQGGELVLEAPGDITIDESVDVSGGEFDGGIVDALAGGDITIAGNIRASAVKSEGFGGEIFLEATGNVTIESGARLMARSNTSSEGFAGDGGIVDLISSGGNIIVRPGSRVVVNGARPDGTGGEISAMAPNGDVLWSAHTRLSGSLAGGCFRLSAAQAVLVRPESRITMRGGAAEMLLTSDADMRVDGRVSLGRGGDLITPILSFQAAGNLDVGARIALKGVSADVIPYVDLDACRLTMEQGSSIRYSIRDGNALMDFTGRVSIILERGSRIQARGRDADIELRYGDALSPPIVDGVVSPTPRFRIDPDLLPCD